MLVSFKINHQEVDIMYKILATLILGFFSSIVFSAELVEEKIYRLSVTAEVKKVGNAVTTYTAMKNNKF